MLIAVVGRGHHDDVRRLVVGKGRRRRDRYLPATFPAREGAPPAARARVPPAHPRRGARMRQRPLHRRQLRGPQLLWLPARGRRRPHLPEQAPAAAHTFRLCGLRAGVRGDRQGRVAAMLFGLRGEVLRQRGRWRGRGLRGLRQVAAQELPQVLHRLVPDRAQQLRGGLLQHVVERLRLLRRRLRHRCGRLRGGLPSGLNLARTLASRAAGGPSIGAGGRSPPPGEPAMDFPGATCQSPGMAWIPITRRSGR